MDASGNRPAESPPESLAEFLVSETPGYLRRLIERQDGGETAGVVYRDDNGELTQTEIAESDGSLIVSPSTPTAAEAPIPIHTHPPDSDARLSAQDYQAFVDRFVATPKPRVTPIQGVAVLYDEGDGTATVHAVSPTRSVFDVDLVERYQIGRQVQFLTRTIPPEQLPERLAGVIEVVDEVATESYATLQLEERRETAVAARLFADPEDGDSEGNSPDSTTGVLDEIEDEIDSLTERDPDPIETDPPESDTAGLESDRVGDAPPPMDVLPDVTSEELLRRPHSYREYEPREFDTVIDREGVEAAREALDRVEAGRWAEMLKGVHDAYVPLDGARGRRSNERARMWRNNPGLLHWVGVWARANFLSDPRADKPDDVGYPFGEG